MRIISEPLAFDWDKGNKDKNLVKHKVEVIEIEEVFSNQPLIVQEDVLHSSNERRYLALGKTNNERKLFLSFTIRINKIRVISARDMSRKEKQVYEKTKSSS